MGDDTMRALALQFNLSETTCLLSSERATARSIFVGGRVVEIARGEVTL